VDHLDQLVAHHGVLVRAEILVILAVAPIKTSALPPLRPP
jgi:hypothetical protein